MNFQNALGLGTVPGLLYFRQNSATAWLDIGGRMAFRGEHVCKLDLEPRADCAHDCRALIRHRDAVAYRREGSRLPQGPTPSFLAGGHDPDRADRGDWPVARRLTRA